MSWLWQWDVDTYRAIHLGLRRDWLDPVMQGLSFSGLGYVQALALLIAAFSQRLRMVGTVAAVCAAAVMCGLVEKSGVAAVATVGLAAGVYSLPRPIALCSLSALASSGVVRALIAGPIGRERPSNFAFSAPLEQVFGSTSFPSGHSTTTFAVATVLCWRYSRSEDSWVAWAGLAWALLVGLSRVYVGVHYPLDVVGGAALGAALGSLCWWVWRQKGWASQEPSTPIARNLS